jgi:sugar lactone lactonase YvrE
LTILIVLNLLLGPTLALGAGKRQLKWITSVYADGKGNGLKYPESVACTDESFVVADTGNRRILVYSHDGPSVTLQTEIELPKAFPIHVQVNSRGDVYFLDGRDRRIVALDTTGEQSRIVTPKSVPSSREIVPKSFEIDADDNFYILDVFSDRVLILDSDEQYLRHIPFPEDHGFFSGLAVDRLGNIFLLDSVEAVVYLAKKNAETFSPLTESLKEFMNFPTSLSPDDRGTLYLVDRHGSGLALVGPDGSFLGRKLGMGWKETGLYYPSQICISQGGVVFIADRSNSRIQLFSLGED